MSDQRTGESPAPPEREPWNTLGVFWRLLASQPVRNLAEYRKLRRVVREPLRALRIRHYPGTARLTHLDLLDGRRIWLRAGTADRHILWGIFIREMYQLGSLASEPRLSCVVDVGAHIGLFSLHVAPFADRVISFEPVSESFDLAEKNLSGDGHDHVEVFNQAVAGEAGKLTIQLSSRNIGGHSAFLAPGKGTGEVVEVEAVRLPDFLSARNIPHVDLLKLDCEGAEYEILASLEEGYLSHVERVVMEYHPRPGSPKDASSGGEWLEERLRKAGFEVERRPRKAPGKGMIFARRSKAAH